MLHSDVQEAYHRLFDRLKPPRLIHRRRPGLGESVVAGGMALFSFLFMLLCFMLNNSLRFEELFLAVMVAFLIYIFGFFYLAIERAHPRPEKSVLWFLAYLIEASFSEGKGKPLVSRPTNDEYSRLDQYINEWKRTYVEPYLDGLEEHRRPVLLLHLHKMSWVNTEQPTPYYSHVSLAYREPEGIILETIPVMIQKDLQRGASPYVSFVQVDDPMGTNDMIPDHAHRFEGLPMAQYDRGNHRHVVHVPEGYTFSLIPIPEGASS